MKSLWDAPLGSVADDIAGHEPAPAGVAAAVVAAAFGVGLLIKTLTISGQRPEIRAAALQVAADLRAAADADCAAVSASLRSPEAIAVPRRALRLVNRAIELCDESAPAITGLLAADLAAGRELLTGAARAISVCLDANLASRL